MSNKGMETEKAKELCRKEVGKMGWKVKVLLC